MNSFVKETKNAVKQQQTWVRRYGEVLAAISCGVLIVVAWILSNYSELWSNVFYILAFVIGGFTSAKEGLRTLFMERDFDVNFLMIIAAIGAASIGFWTEGAILLFIFSLSGALETYTMNRSHRDISSLINLKPESAVLFEDGIESMVSIGKLKIGDIVLVKPGERIPTDGSVVKGTSSVNQATITGEALSVDKGVGDEVFAGTLNEQGALFVKVSQTSESTLFAKIIRLVQEAKSEKPSSQLFIERFERIYARGIIAVSLMLIVIPPFLFQWSWHQAFYKSMVFLVIASPCALVASIMPAILSAISNSARKGLLFKGGAHLENLANTKIIAFDKTGTLTLGKPVVTNVISLQEQDEAEILQIAATLESLSEHPLAKAIVEEAQKQDIMFEQPSEFLTHTGWGIEAQWQGDLWKIGKPAFLEDRFRNGKLNAVVDKLEQEGKTVTVLHNSAGAIGVVALRDTIRTEAKYAVKELKKLGIEVAMLTGDQKQTALAIGKDLGIELVYADLLPEHKLNHIKEFRKTYGSVTMIGDGVNDAPALATASVGIAMGVTGSDTALETADIVLMNDDIARISDAVLLGRRAKTIIKQNITFSLAIIILLITINFSYGIALPLGVIGHEGSTILVILNGLRLLRQNGGARWRKSA